jgi:hypothetical protein
MSFSHRHWFCRAAAIAALLAGPSVASAQLIVGVDDANEPIWSIDPVTNQATAALQGFSCSAMASDEANQVLYFMTNTVTLWKWNYGVIGQPPQLVGTTTNTSGQNLSLVGLGFNPATGQLIASRSLDSSSGPEGFYVLNPTTAVATLDFAVTSNQFGFDGLDYNAANGKFYGLSDTAGAAGLYEVDLANNQLNFVVPLPPTAEPVPDIDGLAVGNGRAYMVEDRAVQAGGRIHVFNFATGQYETALQTPWFFSETFAGGTWSPTLAAALTRPVPEPASLAIGCLGVAFLARRRPM